MGGAAAFKNLRYQKRKVIQYFIVSLSFSRYELHLGIRRAWHFMAPFPLQLGNGTIRDTRRETGNEHDWHRALGSHRIFPLLQEDISEDLNDN